MRSHSHGHVRGTTGTTAYVFLFTGRRRRPRVRLRRTDVAVRVHCQRTRHQRRRRGSMRIGRGRRLTKYVRLSQGFGRARDGRRATSVLLTAASAAADAPNADSCLRHLSSYRLRPRVMERGAKRSSVLLTPIPTTAHGPNAESCLREVVGDRVAREPRRTHSSLARHVVRLRRVRTEASATAIARDLSARPMHWSPAIVSAN